MVKIAKTGYERLTITSIAERASTHETTPYRRWQTKEQLVLETVNHHLAQEIPAPGTGALRSD